MIRFQKPILVIAGPTASGKSDLAIQLAKDIDGYIINGDSRQIYQELKIGTAQPIPEKVHDDIWYIQDVPHYLYGFTSISDPYNIFQYQQDVQKVLDQNIGKTPILVGGTGLYIDSVVYNYDFTISENHSTYTREELNNMTVEQLQSLIKPEDLQLLNESDISNPVRLIRVIERGGVNYKKGSPLNCKYFVLDIEEDVLKQRITQRVDTMIEQGLIEENKELINKGFNYSLPALQSIGYQEFKGFFEDEKSLDQVKSEIITHTLQYAKRQKTWFKRNPEVIYTKPLLASLKAQLIS